MAFSPLMVKLVAGLRSALPAEPTVIELGNQTFKPRTHMLPRVSRWLVSESQPHDAGALEKLAALPPEERAPHTATFYRALGFASYDAIDVNARFGSLRMDLNRDLRSDYAFDRSFDLVTNNGTGEHVFDQRAVLANVHALAKPGLGEPGGVMLHVLPFFNWLNHGFYGFHPLLFVELAGVNGYELLRLSIASNRGREARVTLPGVDAGRAVTRDDARAPTLSLAAFAARASVAPGRALRGRLGRWTSGRSARGRSRGAGAELEAALRWVTDEHPHVSVVAALRRRGDAPFAVPLQGLYAGANVDSPEIRARYALRDAP